MDWARASPHALRRAESTEVLAALLREAGGALVGVAAAVVEFDCDGFEPWLPQLQASLNADEVTRSLRLPRPLDRRRAVIRRGLYRALLGAALDLPADHVPIGRDCFGRPSLGGDVGRNGPAISLSSRGSTAALAFADSEAVGVDVELVDPQRLNASFVLHALHPREQEIFRSVPADERDRWLASTWSFKESLLKAAGVGLEVDPRTVETQLPPRLPISGEIALTGGVQYGGWLWIHPGSVLTIAMQPACGRPLMMRLAAEANHSLRAPRP